MSDAARLERALQFIAELPAAPTTAAERARLKALNAELLKAAKHAQDAIHHAILGDDFSGLSGAGMALDDAIRKAEGGAA